jgi:hypothetical protein
MQSTLQNLTNTLVPAGLSAPDALHQAYGRIYVGLQMQPQTLAYVDTFWMLAMIALCLIRLLLLLRRPDPGKRQRRISHTAEPIPDGCSDSPRSLWPCWFPNRRAVVTRRQLA